MKTLYLLRHAKSEWSDPSLEDHDRPLNARGVENANRMAQYMRQKSYAPALVLCSSSRRTAETLEKIAPALPRDCIIHMTHALYLANPPHMLELLKAIKEDVPSALIIAHSPGTEHLALLLARKDGSAEEREQRKRIEDKFPTAALAVLSFPVTHWRALAPHSGTLQAFIRPKDL